MRPPIFTSRGTLSALAFTLLVAASVAALLSLAAWSARSEAGERHASKESRYSYGFTDDDEFSYAVIGPGQSTHVGSNSRDWDEIRRLIDDDREIVWFSLGGRDYVIRRPEWVARAREIVKPMEELGGRQGKLGAQQGYLGAQQAAIGAKQARLGARQGVLSTRLARLSLRGADEEDREAIERELEQLSRRMEALAGDQQPLARQQEELGRRQAALGHEMERLSKRVGVDMRELADEAMAKGAAERLRD
jgi:hypothetical protein